MKIMYLMDNPVDFIGGAIKSTKTMYEQAKIQNNDVVIFAPDSEETKNSEEEIYSYTTKKRIFNIFNKMKNLQIANKKYSPDIMHGQDRQIMMLAAIMKKIRLLPKSLILVYTDRDFYYKYPKLYKKFFYYLRKEFNKISCTTRINQREWQQALEKNEITYVPNVLDEDWYQYDKNLELKYKKKYETLNSIAIGFAGRYVPYKRWDNVLKICEKLKDNENVKFIFAIPTQNGAKYEEINKYKEEIKKIVGNRANFYLDVDTEKMKELYYAMDIFILTSEGESFGRTLIEAMTKGNIVFGTNSGGVPDVIKNKDFLYEVNDIDEVVRKIEYCIKDMEKYKREFFELVNKEYAMKKFSEKLKELYTFN